MAIARDANGQKIGFSSRGVLELQASRRHFAQPAITPAARQLFLTICGVGAYLSSSG
jgi:hypothetical protein